MAKSSQLSASLTSAMNLDMRLANSQIINGPPREMIQHSLWRYVFCAILISVSLSQSCGWKNHFLMDS